MVRNQVRVQVRYEITVREVSRIDRTETNGTYIRNKPKGQFQQKAYDQINWL